MPRGRMLAVAVVLVVAAFHAPRPGERLLSAASDPWQLPMRLSETGLYDGTPALVAAGVVPFSPQYPLWSDGASKRRWIHLPPGATIDASRDDEWEFPVGTKLWKEFAFDGRPIETRFLWLAEPGRWVFAAYVWSADGTDALLAPVDGVPHAAEIGPGRYHEIPSRDACGACHGSRSPEPLGFTALQLSDDRDPGAIHGEPLTSGMVTLRSLIHDGRLRPARAALVDTPPRIRTRTPLARSALGYLLANCGSCHDGNGGISVRAPVFRAADLIADGDSVARALVDRPTHWQVPGVPAGSTVLVDPGNPPMSALLKRMRSRRPSSQMPPLGTVVADTAALDVITRWIDTELAHQLEVAADPDGERARLHQPRADEDRLEVVERHAVGQVRHLQLHAP